MANGKGSAKKMSPVAWVLIGALIGIAVVAAGWGIYTLLKPKTVEVPVVIGQPVDVAKTTLEEVGFKVSPKSVFDPKAPVGQVISQDPEGGNMASPETTVTVTVSKGAQAIDVPDLVGMTSEDAIAKLKSVGLTVGQITREYSGKLARDLVMRQAPKKHEKLPKGEAVDIVISRGIHSVDVPNVIGFTTSVARRTLGNAGLTANVNPQASSSAPVGTVMSQNPAANESVPINSAVTITVSSGPPQITMPDVRKMGGVAARNKLEALGLVVQSDYVPDTAKVVVKQSPNPGTKLEKGSTVKIYIGDGSRP